MLVILIWNWGSATKGSKQSEPCWSYIPTTTSHVISCSVCTSQMRRSDPVPLIIYWNHLYTCYALYRSWTTITVLHSACWVELKSLFYRCKTLRYSSSKHNIKHECFTVQWHAHTEHSDMTLRMTYTAKHTGRRKSVQPESESLTSMEHGTRISSHSSNAILIEDGDKGCPIKIRWTVTSGYNWWTKGTAIGVSFRQG